MTHDEVLALFDGLDGVVVDTVGEESGAPEIAWGDTFVYYDPADDAAGRLFPFATVVTKDYPGFDAYSDLDRPDVYRLNLNVGRERFTDLVGFRPADFASHTDEFDPTELDLLLPHPTYGQQGWVSIVVPGPRTAVLAADLATGAYERARSRWKPPA